MINRCWSSHCSGDPGYSVTLSEFIRDSTFFCGGGGSPATTPAAGAGSGSSSSATASPASPQKTNAGVPIRRVGGELAAAAAAMALVL
jgi:hypothetical protein